MGFVYISTKINGDPRIIGASRHSNHAAVAVWLSCLLWRSSHRNDPDHLVGEIQPLWFIPETVAKHELGRTRKALPALIKYKLWKPVKWKGQRGYMVLAEGDLWKIKRRTPGVTRRPTIPVDVRHAVYARDGFKCQHCGTGDHLTLDHIYPFSLGGSDEPENLQTLCRSCNSRKGARV